MPTWIVPALGLAADLYRTIASAIAGRAQEAEAARIEAVAKLRALADLLESHPAREQADADAAIDEATAAEIARRHPAP